MNINSPSHYHKRSFVLVYFLTLLNVVTIVLARKMYQFNQYSKTIYQIRAFREMNFIEVLTIKHIKEHYYYFDEDDEEFSCLDYDITITYNDLKATFTIESIDYCRERTLEYDEKNDKVKDYY